MRKLRRDAASGWPATSGSAEPAGPSERRPDAHMKKCRRGLAMPHPTHDMTRHLPQTAGRGFCIDIFFIRCRRWIYPNS
jgi:hypothetical protein